MESETGLLHFVFKLAGEGPSMPDGFGPCGVFHWLNTGSGAVTRAGRKTFTHETCQVVLAGDRPKNRQHRKLCPGFRVAAGITFQLHVGEMSGGTPEPLFCLLVVVARLAGRWCFLVLVLLAGLWVFAFPCARSPFRGPRFFFPAGISLDIL